MKNILVILVFLFSGLHLWAQVPRPDLSLVRPTPPSSDNVETLRWVQDRTDRIYNLLNSAILAGNQVTLIQNMLDAYQEFDAITLVALYCRPALVKAEKGRKMCNLLDPSFDTDLLSLNKRAIDSREMALEIRQDVQFCINELTIDSSALFAPNELIHSDAIFVELDLQDGLASQNFSIFNQKMDHAIRLLEEIALLSSTLENCEGVQLSTQIAKQHALNALEAQDWDTITLEIDAAMEELAIIKQSNCMRSR